MNILVLAAGSSPEREVSISSGSQVCQALRNKGHNAVMVDVLFGTDQEDIFSSTQSQYDLEQAVARMKEQTPQVDRQLHESRSQIGPHVISNAQKADITFLALHGANGEDGRLQAMFDLLGIRYTGSGHLGSAMAMDKTIAKAVMKAAGVPVPEGIVLTPQNRNLSPQELGVKFPCIVKPACGGSSIATAKCLDEQEYQAAVEEAFSYEDQIVVEDYISGREFDVGIFDEQALPVIEIVVPEGGLYGYEEKYSGKTLEICPAQIDEELAVRLQEYAVLAGKALNLEAYARIDFMVREDGGIYCLEANTLPGMTPTSLLPQEAAAMGLDYPNLCEKLVDLSMKKYNRMDD